MSQVFISHAERDGQVARDLGTELEKIGFKVWFYERDSLPGATYISQVAEALRGCQAVVVIVSPESLKSNQVTNEIVRAYEGNKHFIPVLHGITHEEYRNSRDDWRQCFGASTSIGIPDQGVAAIVPRIARGLEHLGIKPGEAPKPPEPKPTPVRTAEPTRPESKLEPARPEPKQEPVAKPASVAPKPERRPPTPRRKLSPWLWAGIAAACLLVVALVLVLKPRPAANTWVRAFGGSGHDVGRSARQTSDGGYIIAGCTDVEDSSRQVLLLKTNARGDSMWARTYGGAGSEDGLSVQQTKDGGYIIAGTTTSDGNGESVYLVKTSASGDTMWTRIFSRSYQDWAGSVQQTADGGYIIAGTTKGDPAGSDTYRYDVYLIKTGTTGNLEWQRTFDHAAIDCGHSVLQTPDSGYVIAGRTRSYGEAPYDFDVHLVETDARGIARWARTFRWRTGDDAGYSIQLTSDGGYVIAGCTDVGEGVLQVLLLKTDARGDSMWARRFGKGDTSDALSVQRTSDLGYVLVGRTGPDSARADVYLVRTDSSGNEMWARTFGGPSAERGQSVQQTKDGGYIIAGYTTSDSGAEDVYLIKTDANGEVD